MAQTRSVGRYEIRRELGRGGTGVVYEAVDAKDHAIVALKTIESAVAEQLYRLKHEFRALADVQHPNLVRFGELTCSDDGEWFFTMELVHGTDFVAYVRGTSRDERSNPGLESGIITAVTPASLRAEARPPLAPAAPVAQVTQETRVRERRLRDALAQVVSALTAIHDAGHVHRDVKPSNVLVSREGRVVVLDFGLVVAATAPGTVPDIDAWMVGTPAYMAPEQIEGGAIGPAADWYALGVMLFLALTGVLPFDGTTEEMMDAKLTRRPPAPDALVPGLPADLCALALELLEVDPAARPAGEEIQRRLEGARAAAPSVRRLSAHGAAFVGRTSELKLLGRALDDVIATGRPRRVIVEGDAGIGKSSLVRRFLQGRADRAVVLGGRCYEQEDVPFKGMDSIVDALSEHLLGLPDDEVEAIAGGRVRYLTALFPVLLRVPAIVLAGSSARAVGNPIAIREQAFGEFAELIGALARRATLIVSVDDFQWADRDSVALFRRVAPDDGAPVLFVATMRRPMEVAPEIAAFAADADRITLRGLSAGESRALLGAIWESRAPDPSVSTDGLIQEADGHPLFLAELARSTREGTKAPGRHVALEDVLWDRIAAHDDTDRRFLEMVALAGAPIAYGVVAAAAGVDPGEIRTRLGSLRASQLVRVGRRGAQRTVEPYHDRVRESILHHLPREAGELAVMHRRLARALLESTPPSAIRDNVFAVVKHFNAAVERLDGRDERREVARLNLVACREALRATAYDRARAYARTGLALLGEEGWQDARDVARDLHIEHMWAAAFAADAEDSSEAERSFREARAGATSERDKTAVHIEWIGILTMRRQLSRAMDVGRERLAELGIVVPEEVTFERMCAQRDEIRRSQAGRSAEELSALPDVRSEVHEGAIRTLVALVPAAFFLDARLRAWIHMSVVLLTVEHGLCDAASYSLSGYGTLLRGVFDAHSEGASFGRAALALNERFPSDRFEARLVFHYGGWHAPWVGPLADAKAMLRRAYELARQYGDTTHETYAATVTSVITFCESSTLVEVRETGTWASGVGRRRKDLDMAGVPEAHTRYAAALLGETPSASDLGQEGSSDGDFRAQLGSQTPTALFYYLFCSAELAWLAGDDARADALLQEAARGDQVISGLPTTLELCLLECLVAARRYERAADTERAPIEVGIERRVERLETWAREVPANYEPQYLLARAELARVRGAEGVDAAYERAWASARAHRAPKREAIALERAASYASARGDAARAEELQREAADAFRRWGAVGKAESLLGERALA